MRARRGIVLVLGLLVLAATAWLAVGGSGLPGSDPPLWALAGALLLAAAAAVAVLAPRRRPEA